MNKVLVMSLLALSFATGFTCSKNAPQQAATPPATTAPAEQAQMATAPGDVAAASADPTGTPPPAMTPSETK